MPCALEAWSLNHWTTREVPPQCTLYVWSISLDKTSFISGVHLLIQASVFLPFIHYFGPFTAACIHYMNIPPFISPFSYLWLLWFPFLAIINKVALNIFVHVLLWIYIYRFFLNKNQGELLEALRRCLFRFNKQLPNSFPSDSAFFYTCVFIYTHVCMCVCARCNMPPLGTVGLSWGWRLASFT